MNTQRPFEIDFHDARQPALLVSARLKSSLNEEKVPVALSPLADFAALGEQGGLSGRHIYPPASGLKLVESKCSDGDVLSWTFADIHIDPSALHVLENMLWFLHDGIAPIARASVSTGLRMPDSRAGASFPQMYEPTPFDVAFSAERRAMDIEIIYIDPQSEETGKRVLESFGAWFCAANAGAFGDSNFPPSASQVLIGDEPFIGDEGVTIYLDSLRCNDAAFDSLVNVLTCVHNRIAPIRAVEFS